MIRKSPELATHIRRDAGQWEHCLITHLIFHPTDIKRLPLIGADFAEFGVGPAFDEIRRQVDVGAKVDVGANVVGDDINGDFDLDIRQFHSAMRDAVGELAGSIVCDWITAWTESWCWHFYAAKIAAASCNRLAAEINDDERGDLNDSTLTIKIFNDRHSQRERLRTETQSRLDGLL